MKVTIIINGKTSLILVPETKAEEEVIKTLNGGKVQAIAQNVTVLQNAVGGGLLITSDQNIGDIDHGKKNSNQVDK